MTRGKHTPKKVSVQEVLAQDPDFVRTLVQETLQQVLEGEMDECLRLIRALAVEIHEDWIEATRYLNMEPLEEQKKKKLHLTAA